jgi:hypothetical protein
VAVTVAGPVEPGGASEGLTGRLCLVSTGATPDASARAPTRTVIKPREGGRLTAVTPLGSVSPAGAGLGAEFDPRAAARGRLGGRRDGGAPATRAGPGPGPAAFILRRALHHRPESRPLPLDLCPGFPPFFPALLSRPSFPPFFPALLSRPASRPSLYPGFPPFFLFRSVPGRAVPLAASGLAAMDRRTHSLRPRCRGRRLSPRQRPTIGHAARSGP